MKFMMNGAITLATLDGANIEILNEVGDENIVIFGLTSKEVLDYYEHGGYSSREIYHRNHRIKRVVDDLINGFIPKLSQDEGMDIYNHLITYNDEYFVLKDFEAYIKAQEKIDMLYKDKDKWTEMAIINIASSGQFTSDKTITLYANGIWNARMGEHF